MAVRTTSSAVKGIIETNCDIPLTPFIRIANILTDKILANDTEGCTDSDLLTEIETWLAAHYYALRDQQYQSKSTDGASATFQGQTGMGLDATFYGQTAKQLDCTGYLADLGKSVAGMTWLGKSEDSPRPDEHYEES